MCVHKRILIAGDDVIKDAFPRRQQRFELTSWKCIVVNRNVATNALRLREEESSTKHAYVRIKDKRTFRSFSNGRFSRCTRLSEKRRIKKKNLRLDLTGTSEIERKRCTARKSFRTGIPVQR